MPYEITYQEISPNIGNPITITSESPSVDIEPVTDGSSYRISVVAINAIGVRGPKVNLPDYIVVGKTLPPANVSNFVGITTKYGNYLSWNPNTEIDLREYEIRKGPTFGTSEVIKAGSTSTSYTDSKLESGTQNYYIRAQDTTDHFSITQASVSIVNNLPGSLGLSYIISGADYKISWVEPSSQYAISHYEIRYGTTWAAGETTKTTTKATSVQNPVSWGGERLFHIAAVDIAGNIGTSVQIGIDIVSPPQPVISTQVVDNNVLFYWTCPQNTLPIDYFELRRGAIYSSATVIGTKSGLFTSLFEVEGGTYVYWIVGIDSAGNYGTPKDVQTTVNQPPDYILTSDFYSTFNGTFSNAAMDLDDLSMPHNLTETFEEHFTTKRIITQGVTSGGTGYAVGDTYRLVGGTYPGTEYAQGRVETVSGGVVTGVSVLYLGEYTVAPTSPASTVKLTGSGDDTLTINFTLNGTSGWATPQEQIDDGFTYYSQPAETTGYYEETIDYGTTLAANKVTITLDTTHTIGTPTVVPTISVSLNGSSWTDYVGYYSIYATNFRYVKIRITATSVAGIALLNIRSINVKLDSKLRNEAGLLNCFAPQSSTYSQTGTTDLIVTFAAHGRLVGQYVCLDFTSGTASDGIYQITAKTTDTYTIVTTSATTSGNVTADSNTSVDNLRGTPTYFNTAFVDIASITATSMGTSSYSAIVNFVDEPNPTNFKILLFDTSGTRVNGTVSWSAKGF